MLVFVWFPNSLLIETISDRLSYFIATKCLFVHCKFGSFSDITILQISYLLVIYNEDKKLNNFDILVIFQIPKIRW